MWNKYPNDNQVIHAFRLSAKDSTNQLDIDFRDLDSETIRSVRDANIIVEYDLDTINSSVMYMPNPIRKDYYDYTRLVSKPYDEMTDAEKKQSETKVYSAGTTMYVGPLDDDIDDSEEDLEDDEEY